MSHRRQQPFLNGYYAGAEHVPTSVTWFGRVEMKYPQRRAVHTAAVSCTRLPFFLRVRGQRSNASFWTAPTDVVLCISDNKHSVFNVYAPVIIYVHGPRLSLSANACGRDVDDDKRYHAVSLVVTTVVPRIPRRYITINTIYYIILYTGYETRSTSHTSERNEIFKNFKAILLLFTIHVYSCVMYQLNLLFFFSLIKHSTLQNPIYTISRGVPVNFLRVF